MRDVGVGFCGDTDTAIQHNGQCSSVLGRRAPRLTVSGREGTEFLEQPLLQSGVQRCAQGIEHLAGEIAGKSLRGLLHPQ